MSKTVFQIRITDLQHLKAHIIEAVASVALNMLCATWIEVDYHMSIWQYTLEFIETTDVNKKKTDIFLFQWCKPEVYVTNLLKDQKFLFWLPGHPVCDTAVNIFDYFMEYGISDLLFIFFFFQNQLHYLHTTALAGCHALIPGIIQFKKFVTNM